MSPDATRHAIDIAVIDLDCRGPEHEIFNAATIQALLAARPGASMRVLTRRSHMKHLGARLSNMGGLLQTTALDEPSDRDQATLSVWACICAFNRLICKASGNQAGARVQFLVLLSCSPRTLLAMKLFAFWKPRVNVLIMFHGALEKLEAKAGGLVPLSDRVFRLMFRWRTSRNVTYGILGRSIEQALQSGVPGLTTPCAVIDSPYLFDASDAGAPPVAGRVSFGHLGYAHAAKGFLRFLELAAGFRDARQAGRAQFLVVGGTDRSNGDVNGSDDVIYAAKTWPVPSAQYAQLLGSITYAVFVYPTDAYRLRASGALFDAIGAAKPVIALRNAYFEYIFGLVGDIGYLCDSMDELRQVCEQVILDFPSERYMAQQSRLADAQHRFSPDAIARQWNEAYLAKVERNAAT
jgi:glycosyltransferase involved in cell wall biosynthesis